VAKWYFIPQEEKLIIAKGVYDMPKMKTKKSLQKRIKISKNGKLLRHHAYTSHLAANKSTKQKKHLSKGTVVSHSDYIRIKHLIQF
jgi:large subunit ribosomal protein L35